MLTEKVNSFLFFLGYASHDSIYFRCFKEKEDGQSIGKKISYFLDVINYKELLRLESQGFGIYVVVNGGGDTDAEVTEGKAIFYEHDDLPKEEQLVLWQKLGLPEPTVQVDTGNKSIHSYWVLEKPIEVKMWKELQADLLEYSDGDRSIKNPSRVMRLPGFKHQETGVAGDIVSSSGNKYSYQELRELVPARKPPTLPPLGDGQYDPNDTSSAKYVYEEINQLNQMPSPLTIFLTKDDRDLIERGVSQGGRNTAGAKLARNLIGTALRLNYLGIIYTDTPEALFNDYCRRCNPPISSKEESQIWKSAASDNPSATLTDDAIENCLKAWQRKEQVVRNETSGIPSKNKATNGGEKVRTKKWDKSQVQKKILALAGQRPRKSQLTIEIKQLSLDSGWDTLSLKEIYHSTIEDFDEEAELGDDKNEFLDILSSNTKLNCKAMLPQELHPILKFAENLGVPYEPTLLVLEAAAASLIDPNTTIIGRECSNYDQNATIFSAIVGEPASRKSPLIQAIARKPLSVMQEKANQSFNQQKIDYEKDLADWEVADKSTRGDKPQQPKLRVFSTGDYTPEGMRELVQYNPKVLRCFDELAKEQKSQGQYKGGKGGDAQLLLESYDGMMDAVIRRGKIYPGGVVNQCLVGGIQPEVLSDIISSSDPTGLFARYNLATLPNTPHYWDDDNEISIDITPLLTKTYEAIDKLPSLTFRLSPDAYQLFKTCHNHCETMKQKSDKSAMIYQYGKMPGKILRWALVYHVIHAVCQGQQPSGIVDKKFIQIAKERARYQISQVRALLSIMDQSKPSKLFQLYQYALRKGEPITPRDAVYKTRKCKDRGEAIDFFRRLEEMGWGKTITTPRAIKFEAFEYNVKESVTTVTEQEEISNSPPIESIPTVPKVEINSNVATSDISSNSDVQQETKTSATTVTQPLSLFEMVLHCDSKEKLEQIRNEFGEITETYNLLLTSDNADEVAQGKKIKLWLYEIALGGELKVDRAVALKGCGNSSKNIWHIKSIESDHIWVEQSVSKKEQPETRRVLFSDIRTIY